MKAMVLNHTAPLSEQPSPLVASDLPVPVPGKHEVLIKISVCGVCHTELDIIEGRLMPSHFPLVPGHQVVGIVDQLGNAVTQFKPGDRVGVAWIFSACGKCEFCKSGRENLCANFRSTGCDKDGGYAEYMVADENHSYLIPDGLSDAEAAPLLCAGAIGHRSLKLTGIEDGKNLGLTGFGASAHLVLKLVKGQYPNTKVFIFARSEKERAFAMELGATWAGDTTGVAPEKLHATIDTTPVWKPVVEALANLHPGGRLVINAIRKETIDQEYLQHLDYPKHLWQEKEIKSVTNVTGNDVREFLNLAARFNIKPAYQEFPLERANEALMELKQQNIRGAKVLKIS